MSLIEVKKCEFNIDHKNITYCSNCDMQSDGVNDVCPNCGDASHIHYEYNTSTYTLRTDLKTVFVNKDHVVSASKVENNAGVFYIITLSHGSSFTINSEDFSKLK